MMCYKFVFMLCALQCAFSTGMFWFRHKKKVLSHHPEKCEFDRPLLLTPLLEKGLYKAAQQRSEVQSELGNMTSYSGFFTVNKKCDSNIFFWFFPAQREPWKNAPLLLWLQGGPGSSSMFGLFEELGPLRVTRHGLTRRQHSWNVENNLLFIDQPVGTGFSYTGGGCYPTNEAEVGRDLYHALVQFYQLFPNLNKNRLYISGESYAGHYIPALGHKIHKRNPSSQVKVPLTAMIIGNGWVDPVSQNDYGDYLYKLGLLDYKQKTIFNNEDASCISSIKNKDWSYAVLTCYETLGRLFDQFIGDVSVYNYLNGAYEYEPKYEMLIQTCEVRKSLHVGNLTFQDGDNIRMSLFLDRSKSVKPWVEELLEFYPIIFYSGQLDIICAYPMSTKYINSLRWSGRTQFMNATRAKWCVGHDQAGYIKGDHRLYDVLVRGAGHMVPTDKPLWAYTLINSITSGSPHDPFHALTICNDDKLEQPVDFT